MNICHVITRLIVGGAQENTLLTCAGLHERGHRVTLVIGPDVGPEGSLQAEAQAGGYDVLVVPSLVRAIRPFQDRLAWQELTREFIRIQPDIVHTHSSKAGILGRLAARDAKIPTLIHTIHGMSFNRTQRWPTRTLYRELERYCGRFTHQIISVADAMTRQAVNAKIANPDKFTTVYSGMRTDWFSPQDHDRQAIRQNWGFGPETVVVGSVARLFRNKGYEQLIPAMAEAARTLPELRFVWVGDGPQRKEYEHQLERFGIRSKVYLTGLLEPTQVSQMLAGLDMLVHASQWEGLPRAAVQSLLMECPVVSFDIDGTREVVIPEQTGILVPLNKIDALAAAIVQLAKDGNQRLVFGRAGRERCLVQFDHHNMVDAIERVYKKLADRSHEPRSAREITS